MPELIRGTIVLIILYRCLLDFKNSRLGKSRDAGQTQIFSLRRILPPDRGTLAIPKFSQRRLVLGQIQLTISGDIGADYTALASTVGPELPRRSVPLSSGRGRGEGNSGGPKL